jgi:hypothetical protein
MACLSLRGGCRWTAEDRAGLVENRRKRTGSTPLRDTAHENFAA